MRSITVIETADELLNAATRVRPCGDGSPMLPCNAELVFEDDLRSVRLEALGFAMDPLPSAEVIKALAARAGFTVSFKDGPA